MSDGGKPRRPGLEFAKFAVTSVISVVISAVYTEIRTDPGRNIDLVPLSVARQASCRIDHTRLKEKAPKEIVADAGSYAGYLQALDASMLGKPAVAERLVPHKHKDKLKDDGVLACSNPDLRYSTFLLVQAGFVLDEPAVYLLKRSCRLRYDSKEIPLTAAPREVEIRSLDDAMGAEPEAMTLKETSNVVFRYDTRDAESVDRAAFEHLLSDDAKTRQISLRCTVVLPDSEVEVGGHRPYSVKAPNFIE
jgi:hypothetical protein